MTSPVLARSISSASSSGRPSTFTVPDTPMAPERFPVPCGAAGRPVASVGPAGRGGRATTIEVMAPAPDGPHGRVFRRSLDPDLPVAVEARGSTIIDATGREYLDAAGGAIVVNVGHGRESVARAMAEQARRLSYAHGSAFTTEPLEAYAREVGVHLPLDGPAIYPVSGGSEAIETALKLARAYHLARGEASRHKIVARRGSYHGNTRGALDASGREPLRRPYLAWLGQTVHVSAPYEYRCGLADHPTGC